MAISQIAQALVGILRAHMINVVAAPSATATSPSTLSRGWP
jgi:hypothetical protein